MNPQHNQEGHFGRTTSRYDPPQRVEAPPHRVLPLNNGTPLSLKNGAPPNRARSLFTLEIKTAFNHRLGLKTLVEKSSYFKAG